MATGNQANWQAFKTYEALLGRPLNDKERARLLRVISAINADTGSIGRIIAYYEFNFRLFDRCMTAFHQMPGKCENVIQRSIDRLEGFESKAIAGIENKQRDAEAALSQELMKYREMLQKEFERIAVRGEEKAKQAEKKIKKNEIRQWLILGISIFLTAFLVASAMWYQGKNFAEEINKAFEAGRQAGITEVQQGGEH